MIIFAKRCILDDYRDFIQLFVHPAPKKKENLIKSKQLNEKENKKTRDFQLPSVTKIRDRNNIKTF